jgi:hypothetical protein
LVLDVVGDGVEVGGLGRVHLAVHGLDADGLQLRADAVDHRRGEGVVLGRVGGRLRPLIRREPRHVLGEQVALVCRGRRLREEDVPELAVEHVR